MRINLFIAFILSTFLCYTFINITSFINEKPYWLYVFPALFLLLFVVYKKVSFLKKTAIKVFIGLSTSVVYLALAFFLLTCVIAFPPEGKFEEKIKPIIVSDHEINMGNQLCMMLEDFDKKLGPDDKNVINAANDNSKFDESKVIELLNKTGEDRRKIAEFIKSNSIANPYGTYTDQEISSGELGSNRNRLQLLFSLFKMELLEVRILQAEGKYTDASEKFVSLWDKLSYFCKIKNTSLTDSLTFMAIAHSLGKYYYDNQSMFLNGDLSKVGSMRESFMNSLDQSFESAFSNEYIFYKKLSENYKNTWPFMDKNSYLRKLDGFYYAMIEGIKRPYDKSITCEEPIDTQNLKTPIYLTKNPVGEVLYSITYSMFSGLASNTTRKKNELAVYFYAMSYANNTRDVPIDYFTGEKVKTVDFPDHIEVEVKTNRNSGTKKFIINKKTR